MQVYHIDSNQVNIDIITAEGDLHHHLSRVLRIKNGEELRFSDGVNYYDTICRELTKGCSSHEIISKYPVDDEPGVKITLLQGYPRGDKADTIVKRCTELGVTTMRFCGSDNSQVKIKGKEEQKRERLQKVADSAAEQCGRGVIPEILMPCSLKEAVESVKELNNTHIIFCYERENKQGFKSLITSLKDSGCRSLAVIIGPEGGFSKEEADYILAQGGHAVTLGKRILRTETAAPAVAAAIMCQYDEWETLGNTDLREADLKALAKEGDND